MQLTPLRPLLLFLALAATSLRAGIAWADALRQPDAWYASPAARDLAAGVVLHQTPSGGWPKNTDLFRAPDAAHDHPATIDNGATTTPVRFLARVVAPAPDASPAFRAACERGVDYLLAAQYPNGGWPQFFPLKKGYYTRITYNDDAMAHVLVVLRDAASGDGPYAWLDSARRERAADAVRRGIDCILKTQVRQNGALTVWCAQHDETTLAPAWARNFEPPSLSGGESVGVVRFLMSVEKPTPAIVAAVEGAVAWFEKTRITGLRYDRSPGGDGKPDRRVVPDPAAPPLWARFHELETGRPLFVGRDRVFHYALADIERERRAGYAYYTTAPGSLLTDDHPRWRKRLADAKP